jgi:hypothetical protein
MRVESKDAKMLEDKELQIETSYQEEKERRS